MLRLLKELLTFSTASAVAPNGGEVPYSHYPNG
jgi:hypothetical protein